MKRTIYIAIALIGYFAISCTKEIDVQLDDTDRRLVVDAWFTSEVKSHEIRLTETASFFSNEPAPLVSGASVQISGGGDVWNFTEAEPGIYRSTPDAHAKYGNEYTLSITHNGELYEAKDYCDTVPEIDGMYLYYNEDTAYGNWYDILIWTQELAGFGHYYCWRVLVNGEYLKDTLSEIYFDNDEYLGDGLVFEAFPVEWVGEDEVSSGDTVTLEQHNISKETYKAFEAVMTETAWKGGLFDTPPANIETNISNNGFGVFVVSAVAKAEAIVP